MDTDLSAPQLVMSIASPNGQNNVALIIYWTIRAYRGNIRSDALDDAVVSAGRDELAGAL